MKPLIFCLVLCLVFFFTLSPIRLYWQYRADSLKKGMTKNEIEMFIGIPQSKHRLYGDDRWCYWPKFSNFTLYLIFDESGGYSRYEIDN